MARAASAQRGVLHRSQLRAAGLTDKAIAYRVQTERLHPDLPGVFFVGHRATQPLAPETAALLYAGDNTVLSHRTAAALWRIAPEPRLVELTVINHHVRTRPGLKIRHAKALDIRDIRIQHGLPVTSPARTLIDHAAAATGSELEKTLNEARVQRIITDHELHQTIARYPRRKGTRNLRSLLKSQNEPGFTRSEAERLMRNLLRQAELPQPDTNARLLGFEIDFLWPAERLILEVDGAQFHNTPQAFENDRRRDQVLTAAGYRVIRVTWHQLKNEPLAVLARIAQALRASA